MKDKLIYKEFIGTVHFSAEDEVFYGQIEGINDLVTFEGEDVKTLKQSFAEAVDNYIEICKEEGKDPQKSFKGSFNVRISPELHSKIFERATLEGKSLNQFVQSALEKMITTIN